MMIFQMSLINGWGNKNETPPSQFLTYMSKQLASLKEEFYLIFALKELGDIGYDIDKVWSFIEHSLKEAVKEERERLKGKVEDLKERPPFTYHDERLPYKRACEDVLSLLTQKP